MQKTTVLLIAILSLSLFLRFFLLTVYPPSLYWDEVSIGYNANSILQTGRDEWGRTLPFFFEAFNEFKFPVAIYLVSLSIKIFGFTDFAVRFPSAFLGTLAPALIFFFVKSLIDGKYKTKIALFCAFIMSISLWHLQFSRAMFEANAALAFELISLILLLSFLKKPNIFSGMGFFLFLFLTIYSYSVQIFSMFFLTVIFIITYVPARINKIKYLLLFLVCFVVLEIPFLIHVQNDKFTRFGQVSIFRQNPTLEKAINLRAKYGGATRYIFNQYTAAAVNYAVNLFSHLDPRFLFPGRDGNPRHSVGLGLVYPPEIIFLPLGAIFLFVKNRKLFFLTLLAFLACLTPAALTQESPHALRSLNSLPFYLMLFGVGLLAFMRIKNKLVKNISFLLFVLAYYIFMRQYLNVYYLTYPKTSFSAWGGENNLMMAEAKKYDLKNTTVYFTGAYWRPYIYYYYDFHVPPEKVQKYDDSTRFENAYFGYAAFDRADRRYNYDFKTESLLSRPHLLLFLSPSEIKDWQSRLTENGINLTKNVFLEKKLIFAIYEK